MRGTVRVGGRVGAPWIGEAPRLDARCVRRETDAGIGFATMMDDAGMAVEGGAVDRHRRAGDAAPVNVLKYPVPASCHPTGAARRSVEHVKVWLGRVMNRM